MRFLRAFTQSPDGKLWTLDLAALEAEVTEQETVDAGAANVITQLLNEVEANKTSPTALQALVDRGRAATAALAAAVATVPPAPPTTPA